ncbi:OmpH family outer membrane protein [Cytophagaceae bacterium ABcell3]|nr:OmpH family outer membrane protein [Cytophagaceae bacterium ABcell3]
MRTKAFLFLTLFFLTGSLAVNAQDIRIGYTSLEYVFEKMPESEQIKNDLQTYEKKLQDHLKEKYDEFEKKLEAYQAGANTMAESVKQTKERELQQLQMSIREFENKAQQDLQKKHAQLTDPVLDRIQDAINKVGKDKGYAYILSGEGAVLYAQNKEDDVSELVLKELGVNAPGASAPTSSPSIEK